MKDKSIAAPLPQKDLKRESKESPEILIENIYSELYCFTITLLDSSAYQKPQTSPEKPEQIFPKHRTSSFFASATRKRLFLDRAVEFDPSLKGTEVNLFFTGPITESAINADLYLTHIQSGRFYDRLMIKAGIFKEMLSTKSHDNCRRLFLRWGVHPSFVEKLLANYLYLTVAPMRLIMFLSLAQNYPTVDNETIWSRLEDNVKSGDTYIKFKELELELFQSYPTRKSLELAQTPEDVAVEEASHPSTPKSAAVTRKLGDSKQADSDTDTDTDTEMLDEDANSLRLY